MAIEVQLDKFSGPLDLLLHLIRSNEMDIYDIPMVEITEQYLAAIEQMKQLDLDVAGEFLLMAATLIHVKSQMLLPISDVFEEEEEDPRAELVRRLLEYQRYKPAADTLAHYPLLDRDTFASQFVSTEVADESEDGVLIGVYQLAEAFHRLLRDAPVEVFHEVIREQLSVAERVQIVLQLLAGGERVAFSDIFTAQSSRLELVVTFLATLELVKMRMVKIDQANEFGEIWLMLAVAEPQAAVAASIDEDLLGYG